MSFFTSTDFASACSNGTDWRDTSKLVLEQLELIRTQDDGYNFGFLYISDQLADDTTSIYNLFRSVLKIDNWIGSVGMGVIGNNEALIDAPAISAMIGRLPENSFCIFPKEKNHDLTDDEENADDENLEKQGPHTVPQGHVQQWLIENTPLLSVVHADPLAQDSPQGALSELEQTTNSFLVGGLTSSRTHHFQIANQVCDNALCGAFFADTIPVSTTLSQGCAPIGKFHTITKTDDNVILELDDKRAIDVLQDNLRNFACEKLGKEPKDFISSFSSVEASDQIPAEFKNLFNGQIHVGLPFSQSDQKDYVVRNIMGIDVDEGSITISDNAVTGKRLFFVERDKNSVASDLSKSLIALRKRVMAERGSFEPKGALYISCIARAFSDTPSTSADEMTLIHDIIGDVPLTGFYAGGEINNARLYSYTGVLTLFF